MNLLEAFIYPRGPMNLLEAFQGTPAEKEIFRLGLRAQELLRDGFTPQQIAEAFQKLGIKISPKTLLYYVEEAKKTETELRLEGLRNLLKAFEAVVKFRKLPGENPEGGKKTGP